MKNMMLMNEEDDVYLPPGVKFTITSTLIQLLKLKGMFRGVAGDDAY